MSTVRDGIQECYARLATRGQLRLRRDVEHLCDEVASELRVILQTIGADPDEQWAVTIPRRAPRFPELLYVSEEEETNGDKFLIAQERGIYNCADGTPLGVYRLESTARVKVTVEALEVSSPPSGPSEGSP